MYKLYVRPHLEYCVEVWNPTARGDINKLEKVQNKMTKLTCNTINMNPEQRNMTLGLSSHEQRRLRGDLINMYKNIDNDSIFSLRDNPRFRGHEKVVRVPMSNCLIKKHSFGVRTIEKWNLLPSHIVNSSSLNVFKRNIDTYFNA